MVYKATELGLRPLAVHLDNGWDSRLAVTNIERVLNKLGVDLYTHVIDWEEFKDLQRAYLKASVIDVEVVTDHAILALLYRVADQYKIKFVLSGDNVATEGLMGTGWNYPNKYDLHNLKAIHRKFGEVRLATYPAMSMYRYWHYAEIKNIRRVRLLRVNPETARTT